MFENPFREEKRFKVLHIRFELGSVIEGLLLFEGKKAGDYHEEMNACVLKNGLEIFCQSYNIKMT